MIDEIAGEVSGGPESVFVTVEEKSGIPIDVLVSREPYVRVLIRVLEYTREAYNTRLRMDNVK